MENTQEKMANETLATVGNEEIKNLLLENQVLLAEIREQTEKTKKYIRAGRVISFIYLILIVAPLIFAAVYLPPLLKSYVAPYQELLGTTPGTSG
ncbi:MAG TPA: hypothetical protein PLR18_04040, partial [bacterium]|nr:hypothetical protein [bacterium]